MTRPSVRDSPPPLVREASSSSVSSSSSLPVPSGAVVHNLTPVASASRLLECSQIIRQNQFLHLVRHFLSQILYGCTDAYCTTPTCLSCSKRLVSKPFRAPTQLTARALAYYLASQDSPHLALCPHPLKVLPDSLVLQDASGGIVTWCNQEQIRRGYTPPQFPFGGGSHNDNRTHDHVLRMKEAIHQRHQAKKDPKSLGQSMYDTVAIIFSYSKQLPNPRSIFDLMRSYNEPDPSSDLDPLHSSGTRLVKVDSRHRVTRRLANGQGVHKVRHVSDSNSIPSMNGSSDLSYSGKSDLESQNPSTLRVTSHLTCRILIEMSESEYHLKSRHFADTSYRADHDSHYRDPPAEPFVNQSLFYTLSSPECLLRSFRDLSSLDYTDSPLPHLDAYHLTNAFGDWKQRNGALIFDSLCVSVEALFRPPPELINQKSPRSKPSRKAATPDNPDGTSQHSNTPSSTSTRYLSNEEAAHIVMICVHALTALVPVGWPATWKQLRVFRGWGVVIPRSLPETSHTHSFSNPWLRIVDELEYEPALRLADRLLSGIGTRMCFEHILESLHRREESDAKYEQSSSPDTLSGILIRHLIVVEGAATGRKTKMKSSLHLNDDPGWTVTATLMEWLRTTIVKKFNGNGEINKWGSVGAAMTLLKQFYDEADALNLRKDMFSIPYVNERMDTAQEPNKFLSWKEKPNTFHVLQLPFLFKDKYLVAYFRTINFTRMFNQFQTTGRATHLEARLDHLLGESHWQRSRDALNVTMQEFLRLQITRKDPLKETLDQLWGQEKRMLLKPLKVKIGVRDGELGLDQGGVTYEFFRLVLRNAFKPENGMFVVDQQTSMIWFHPAPFEPKWKFHMLGVLFSLAVYNGITLPVTFPLAFYANLLDPDHPHMDVDKESTDYIRDGWPTLARSFDELLSFDGDVAETYMRDYAFSYEAYGHTTDIDMQTSLPVSSTADTTPLVTNENRDQFVKDYITWLTHTSIEPYLSAFRAGFNTCLHPVSLHLFTPSSLRALVEGDPEISVAHLRAYTRYEDGYAAAHPTIQLFWSVVETFDQEQLRHLLEFVTANARVPVTGYESMCFTIVRAGEDTGLLPTSSTCFGKLLLPEYRDVERLRGKLEIALRYSEGFGSV